MSGLFFLLMWAANSAWAAPSLAVTYFESTGEDPSMDPLKKGIAEMLITDLSVSSAITIVERARLNDILGFESTRHITAFMF